MTADVPRRTMMRSTRSIDTVTHENCKMLEIVPAPSAVLFT